MLTKGSGSGSIVSSFPSPLRPIPTRHIPEPLACKAVTCKTAFALKRRLLSSLRGNLHVYLLHVPVMFIAGPVTRTPEVRRKLSGPKISIRLPGKDFPPPFSSQGVFIETSTVPDAPSCSTYSSQNWPITLPARGAKRSKSPEDQITSGPDPSGAETCASTRVGHRPSAGTSKPTNVKLRRTCPNTGDPSYTKENAGVSVSLVISASSHADLQ